VTGRSSRVNQCQNPTGRVGRLVLRNMNSRHSKVTDWGLSHASIGKQDIVLDVGCGGGRTVSKLAAIATQGKVYGIDHSSGASPQIVSILPYLLSHDLGARISKDNRFRPTEGMEGRDPGEALVSE
jgi:SAM-dependent methyltransferase